MAATYDGFVYSETHCMLVTLKNIAVVEGPVALLEVLELVMLFPPKTIITFPGSITAPCPYIPLPEGCCVGTSHCQFPDPPKPVPRLRIASCGSAAWLTSPTQPPRTIMLPPSSLRIAVCPDLLSTLVTVLLMASSVFPFAEVVGEFTVTKLQLSSGRLQIAT
jgi:hypothetical protein